MAAGHEGIGITEAPITGLLVSQMLTGAPMEVSVDAFAPERFALYDRTSAFVVPASSVSASGDGDAGTTNDTSERSFAEGASSCITEFMR